MSSVQEPGEVPAARERHVVVVVDMVESVRLMQAYEDHVIALWRRFVRTARDSILPLHGGRMVKSLGDGMLLVFVDVLSALTATRALQALLSHLNVPFSPAQHLHVRFGAHVADLVVDEIDVFGNGVNIAARLATLASPGQIVVSSDVQDGLTPALDGDSADLGECYLKHVDRPVRAFRLSASTGESRAASPPVRPADELRPVVCVLPIVASGPSAHLQAVAGALTDDLVSLLAQDAGWIVVSRLSTSALAGREMPWSAVRSTLGAEFVVCGSVRDESDACLVEARLCETRHGEILDAAQWRCGTNAMGQASNWPTTAMAGFVCSTILSRQITGPHLPALPNVPSYALLLRAISLLHRLGGDEMDASKQMLDHLVDRHPRSPEALAWSAKWHFLQLAQVSRTDLAAQLRTARARLAQGLDARPQHAMSLALEGHLLSFADGDTRQSEYVLRQAVAHGPNEPLAWMYLSGVLANTGRGAEAVAAIRKAMVRSPLDPMTHDMDLFAADAHKVAGDLALALVHAQRSVQRNAMHLSSWVQLIILQMLNGQVDQARASAAHYLVMRPAASVKRFLDRHPARGTPLAERDAAALIEAGIPH